MPTGFTMGMSEHPRNYALEARIIELRDSGMTLEEVGFIVDRSRERVRQIEARYRNEVPHSEAYKLWKLVCVLFPEKDEND